MKKVIIMFGVLCSLSMVASEDKSIVDDQKLQKQVEQVLLNEVFVADAIVHTGTNPYIPNSIAQQGDLAGAGVCAVLTQGYFSIIANESNIVLCRERIVGDKNDRTRNEILNKWIKRSIKLKGFTVMCKRRSPYNHHPVQSMCIDEESNPQVQCNVYNPTRGSCWTTFKLTVSKEVFESSIEAYCASLLKSNFSAKQQSEVKKRMKVLL